MTIWTARVAAALYVVALALLIRNRWKGSRLASTLGVVVYLVHVGCAFEFFYAWSHSVAYRETARQTAELFGVDWGGGLYLNYVFTILWLIECVWSWMLAPGRIQGVRIGVHAFLAFMVVNATAVVWLLRALRNGR